MSLILLSDIVTVALIATIVPTSTAVISLIVSWMNGRRAIKAAEIAASVAHDAAESAKDAASGAHKMTEQLNVVGKQIDGRMEQLLKTIEAEALKKGEDIGRQKMTDERAARLTIDHEAEDRAGQTTPLK